MRFALAGERSHSSHPLHKPADFPRAERRGSRRAHALRPRRVRTVCCSSRLSEGRPFARKIPRGDSIAPASDGCSFDSIAPASDGCSFDSARNARNVSAPANGRLLAAGDWQGTGRGMTVPLSQEPRPEAAACEFGGAERGKGTVRVSGRLRGQSRKKRRHLRTGRVLSRLGRRSCLLRNPGASCSAAGVVSRGPGRNQPGERVAPRGPHGV